MSISRLKCSFIGQSVFKVNINKINNCSMYLVLLHSLGTISIKSQICILSTMVIILNVWLNKGKSLIHISFGYLSSVSLISRTIFYLSIYLYGKYLISIVLFGKHLHRKELAISRPDCRETTNDRTIGLRHLRNS